MFLQLKIVKLCTFPPTIVQDVDIKRQGATTAFAFVQYADITSVVGALRAMEGEHIGINKIKV